MADITVLQMPAFKRVYKKLAASHPVVLDEAVRMIVADPESGEAKKGDRAGVNVCKFPLNRQQMPLACEWAPGTRVLLLLGGHENFYRDLKRH